MNELFETCGYIASFLGTFIEGEILLLTSVMSSKLGYFNYFGGNDGCFFRCILERLHKIYTGQKIRKQTFGKQTQTTIQIGQHFHMV